MRDLEYIEEFCKNRKILCVVYDFFAISGLLYANKHCIRSVCSIPAILSPQFENVQQSDLDHIAKYKFTHSLGKPRLASDGYLFLGDDNIAWTYEKLYKDTSMFNHSERIKNIQFVGSLCSTLSVQESTQKVVYVSFGTVVPTLPNVQPIIKCILNAIIRRFSTDPLYISYPNAKSFIDVSSHPSLTIVDYCDQTEILKRSSLFITHGGGNSLNEAITYGVPMVVIPFFGDQYVTARCVHEGRIGKALLGNDFGNSTTALKEVNEEKLKQCIQIDENEMEEMRRNLHRIRTQNSFDALDHVFNRFSELFKEGDLLYGTTIDRIRWVNQHGMQERFKIGYKNEKGEYLTVDELGIVPCLIDQWNDLIRTKPLEQLSKTVIPSGVTKELTYFNYIKERMGDPTKIPLNGVEIIEMCCHGMDFFLNQGVRIHFVIYSTTDLNKHLGTQREFAHVTTKYKNNPSVVIWKQK